MPMDGPWPFAQWGIDIIRPLPMGKGRGSRLLHLNLLEEKINISCLRVVAYQQRIARCHNSKVKFRVFQLGNLVLRQNIGTATWSLHLNWEGPYRVIEIARPGTYYLEDMRGRPLRHPWHVEHLLRYFS